MSKKKGLVSLDKILGSKHIDPRFKEYLQKVQSQVSTPLQFYPSFARTSTNTSRHSITGGKTSIAGDIYIPDEAGPKRELLQAVLGNKSTAMGLGVYRGDPNMLHVDLRGLRGAPDAIWQKKKNAQLDKQFRNVSPAWQQAFNELGIRNKNEVFTAKIIPQATRDQPPTQMANSTWDQPIPRPRPGGATEAPPTQFATLIPQTQQQAPEPKPQEAFQPPSNMGVPTQSMIEPTPEAGVVTAPATGRGGVQTASLAPPASPQPSAPDTPAPPSTASKVLGGLSQVAGLFGKKPNEQPQQYQPAQTQQAVQPHLLNIPIA